MDALEVVEAGSWTTYADLADLSGLEAGAIGGFVANRDDAKNSHRVLQASGAVSPAFRWREPDRGDDVRDVLEREGIEFDELGRANQAQRMTAEDLREALQAMDDEAGRRRAWLVRGSSVNGQDLIPTWLAKGSMSLAASRLRAVEPGLTRDDLKPIVDEDYAHTSYAAKAEKLDEFHAFLSRMQIGDLVATTSQGTLYVGEIRGPANYVTSEDKRSNLRREVEWAAKGVDYADLGADVAAKLQSQRDVSDLTQQLETLEAYWGASEVEPVPRVKALVLRDATQELADDLHVDRSWLQECVDLLRDRPQLIFYGPPGTGKTFIAQKLAAHLAGDNVKLVQFHPAYSYEDFFEGYRPVQNEAGNFGFELKPGPLRSLVDQANANPESAYVLIIDEINRGNLAKIFGELYFLLEYRDKNVDLLYATGDDEGFTLPPNVFIIGTMNTADRSIALVDAAMRRRFAFLPLHPSEPPTSGVLRRWLESQGHDIAVADLLDELNRRIEDPDFKIGPSYFMRPAVFKDRGIDRVWRTAILPLLEEHHYGEGVDVAAAYGLDSIRTQIAKAASMSEEQSNISTSPQDEDDETPPTE
jgi:5-methylcytosine-specific restriction protein B